jgi:putative tryptophan/tyrosine transport system substrate-binding protein
MKCSRCAQENPPQDKFCPECGTRLRGDLASNGGSDRQAQIQNDDLRRALAEAAEQQAATAETLKVTSASPNTACSVNWAFCGVYAPQVARAGGDMRRRDVIGVLATCLLVAPRRALAQQSGKMPHIGVLVSASPPHPFADAFRRGLQSFGYTEGQNIRIEFLYTEERADRAAQLAAELVRTGVDIIVAHFTPAIRAAIGATRTIPIVMAPAGAPLQMGFIASLAHPGGNVTGLSGIDAEIGGKRLQLLKELIPDLKCVAVLSATPATNPYGRPFVEDLQAAAARAGIRLVPAIVGGVNDFESAFATMAKERAQAVIVLGSFDPHRKVLLDLAAKRRLAYMSSNRETVVAGALVSLSANYAVLYERSAYYVDKIIKGARPADLPVEQPTKLQAVMNLKTAHALGLTISPVLLAQIDEIIE